MKKSRINSPVPILLVFVGLTILLLGSCSTARYNAAASHQHVDPVCGMTVDKNTGFTDTYESVTYHFDSEECLSVFRKNKEKFGNGKQQFLRNSGMGGMHMGWWGPVMGAIMVVGMAAAMVLGLNH